MARKSNEERNVEYEVVKSFAALLVPPTGGRLLKIALKEALEDGKATKFLQFQMWFKVTDRYLEKHPDVAEKMDKHGYAPTSQTWTLPLLIVEKTARTILERVVPSPEFQEALAEAKARAEKTAAKAAEPKAAAKLELAKAEAYAEALRDAGVKGASLVSRVKARFGEDIAKELGLVSGKAEAAATTESTDAPSAPTKAKKGGRKAAKKQQPQDDDDIIIE